MAVVGLIAEAVRDMPHKAAGADPEALLLGPGPLEPLGLGIACVLVEGGLHRTRVGMVEVHGLSFCDEHHDRVDLAMQMGTRVMCGCLRLSGRIHDHAIHASPGEGLGARACLDGELEHSFIALLADPLSPLNHLAGIDRELGLENLRTDE